MHTWATAVNHCNTSATRNNTYQLSIENVGRQHDIDQQLSESHKICLCCKHYLPKILVLVRHEDIPSQSNGVLFCNRLVAELCRQDWILFHELWI